MPQMAPISWLLLFMILSIIFLTFNCLNYFSFLPQAPETTKKSISQTSLNWKW